MEEIIIPNIDLGVDITYEVHQEVLNYIIELEEIIIEMDEETKNRINYFNSN